MRLVLCSRCQRHVRVEDGQCPFCGDKTRPSGAGVVGVACALIVGLGVAAGCSGSTDSGGGSGGTTSDGGDGGSGGVVADSAPDAIGDGDIEGAVAAYGPPPDASGTGGMYGPPPP